MKIVQPEAFLLRVVPTAPAQPLFFALQPEQPAECEAFRALLTRQENVWGLTLQAKTALPLDSVELRLQLPEALWDEDLLFYDNMAYTNDVTEICRWVEHPQKRVRDVTALHHEHLGMEFGLGQVTAHRFYAELGFAGGALVQYTDMEGKPLNPGETYTLEKFVFSAPQEDVTAFLNRYADTVAALNGACPLEEIPVGWCSWSCYYSRVNEENIGRAAASTAQALGPKGANLLQIDDGWQQCGSFPGKYETDEDKFPQGLLHTAETVRSHGMEFGLWLAPLLINENSRFYEELKPIVNTGAVTLRADGDVHPFNYDSPAFYDHLYEMFSNLTQNYGVHYYKLDFLAASFRRFVEEGTLVYSQTDYCVALFRKALQTIRRAVGPQVTLVSCGAPVLEGAGSFNAARMSCDIIWGKNPEFPTYWQIMQRTTRTVLYRAFYNRKVFLNDPDGIVLRDSETGDGFNCTYSEARLWATAVALSGGSVLVNEELEKLSEARRSLFTALVPPLGVAARPLSFFETPAPTLAVLDYSSDVKFAASFHWGDTLADRSFTTAQFGFEKALVVRCWDKKVLGVLDTVEEKNCLPHSAELYLLYRVPQEPCFLYSEINLFGGVSLYHAALQQGAWQLTVEETARTLPGAVYGWVPQGFVAPGTAVQTFAEGSVVKLKD